MTNTEGTSKGKLMIGGKRTVRADMERIMFDG